MSGLHGERPGDRHALAHAARKLGRPAVGGMRQPDHLDVALRDGPAFGAGLPLCTASTARPTLPATVSQGMSE
jgi:hypothetical protein